ERVRGRLLKLGLCCELLDGDRARASIQPTPGYDDQGRSDFYETLARLAALKARQGAIVLVPATAHLRRFRARAKELAPPFLEVFASAPLEVTQRRDQVAGKDVYGQKKAFVPGQDIVYEPPTSPDAVAHGGHDLAAVDAIIQKIVAVPLDDLYVSLSVQVT